MKIYQSCSPFLSPYLLQVFGDLDISEKTATCHDCLCSRPERKNLPFYQKHLKCCTFHPFLPNYEVGAILASEDVGYEAKEVVRQKIQRREYALPLGVFAPVSYQVAFNQREPADFGNKESFLCPYFDRKKEQCGIWRHRGSVCTSYFCASDRGAVGLEFWERLGDYLHVCEMVLAQDCVVSMGLPPDCIDGQLEYINCATGTPEELAINSMSVPLHRSYWVDWSGDIEEYYLSCCRYLKNLSPREIGELLRDEIHEIDEDLLQFLADHWKPV